MDERNCVGKNGQGCLWMWFAWSEHKTLKLGRISEMLCTYAQLSSWIYPLATWLQLQNSKGTSGLLSHWKFSAGVRPVVVPCRCRTVSRPHPHCSGASTYLVACKASSCHIAVAEKGLGLMHFDMIKANCCSGHNYGPTLRWGLEVA
jgi:hypothetical protein